MTPHNLYRAIKQDADEPATKKIKSEVKTEVKTEVKDEVDGGALDKLIEDQKKEYFKIRDNLKAETKKAVWLEILGKNKQTIPSGDSAILDHLADVITFGAIVPCTKCKNGNFVFGNSAYLCTGHLSEWAKCDNIVKEPKRKECVIPKDIKSEYSFLSKKRKVQTRAVKTVAPMNIVKTEIVKKEVQGDMELQVSRTNWVISSLNYL